MTTPEDNHNKMTNDKDTKAAPQTVTRQQFCNAYWDINDHEDDIPHRIFDKFIAPMQQELQRLKVDYSSAEHDFDLKCEELKRLDKNMTEYATSLQQEIEQLKGDLLNALRGIKIRDGDIQRQRDTIELLQERNVKLEGLLRETKTYVEYDRNQAIKYSHPTTLATSLLERITSALSGTEEKQKPDA